MRGGGWRSARVGTSSRLSHVRQDRNGMTRDQHPRTAGVQLHPTSLPSGRLDDDAYAFVDWLAAAGQTWWQMLPLGPPDEFGSALRARPPFFGFPRLLADPKAPVSESEVEELVARQSYWVGGWARFS